MNEGGNTVTKLLTLTTDVDSSSATGATSDLKFIDTTLEEQQIDISVHALVLMSVICNPEIARHAYNYLNWCQILSFDSKVSYSDIHMLKTDILS